MVPQRIQLSRKKGWRKPENTVVVSRPGYFGNPFKVGVHGDAAECVRLFQIALEAGAIKNLPYKKGHHYGWQRHLQGKNLACWCPLGSPCHGDVLLEIVNR